MRILLAPECRPGVGTGHLRRAIALQADLEAHPGVAAAVYLERDASWSDDYAAGVETLLERCPAARMVRSWVEVEDGTWEIVVLDRFSVSVQEANRFASVGLTVGVDAGGPGRLYCDYRINTLARLDGESGNVHAMPGALPDHTPLTPGAEGRVLVTFGGEDPARLTEAAAALLLAEQRRGKVRSISCIRPSLRRLDKEPAGVTWLDPLPELTPLYREHEWVVTAFGLTAYEAAAAGRKVVTVAPTPYHDRLAWHAGFTRAGVAKPSPRRLHAALRRGRAVAAASRRAVSEVAQSRREVITVPRIIAGLELPEVRGCPAYPGTRGPEFYRTRERSYFRCPRSSLVYMERFAADREEYAASYFAEEYRRQYGRTYLEDFDSIKEAGHRRLAKVERLLRVRGTALDIGCAYGPFLSALAERGYTPFGVDVSGEAVAYVRQELGLPAVAADVLGLDPAEAFDLDRFDLVSLWYVIEHFADLAALLKGLRAWVRPGGVLAFSTPYGDGISARPPARRLYQTSPRDHHTIWNRRSAKIILGDFGFTVRRIVHTGHHPERYPSVQRRLVPRWLALAHSRVFGRGDTFEVYATRNDDE